METSSQNPSFPARRYANGAALRKMAGAVRLFQEYGIEEKTSLRSELEKTRSPGLIGEIY